MNRIDIGRDFSKAPGGRSYADGDKSGEQFLKDVLIPALLSNDVVEIYMDGCDYFTNSFLKGVFGNIALQLGIEEAKRRVIPVSCKEAILRKVNRYMESYGFTYDEIHSIFDFYKYDGCGLGILYFLKRVKREGNRLYYRGEEIEVIDQQEGFPSILDRDAQYHVDTIIEMVEIAQYRVNDKETSKIMISKLIEHLEWLKGQD